MLPQSVPPRNVSVLLVDDEPDVLEFLHLLLTSKMQGATVDRADSGRAALERIVATDYDVVVSDVVMPGMSGLKLLERIRAIRPDTPVVLITGFNEREMIVRALRGGAFDFIEKPIDHDNFLATITRAVRMRRLSSTVEEQKAALERHAAEMGRIVEERTLTLRNEITERKRVEGELHSALDRLRAVIGSSPIAIISLDTQGRVTGWNQAAEHMFGWTEEEVLGRELPYLAPGQEQESETIWERVMRGEGLGGLEFRRLRKDGTPVDIAVWATRLFDQHGTVIGSMGLQVDITERKQAEEMLRESEAFTNRILQSSPDCVKVLDLEGRLLYMNDGGKADMEIRTLAPFIGSSWIDFWNGEDRETARAVVEAARAGCQDGFVGFCPTATGKPKWWDVLITPIFDVEGKPDRLLAISRDITEQRQAEEALQQAHQKHQELVDTIDGIVWEADAQTFQFSYVSQKAERLLGYPLAQWLNEPTFWADHIHPDDRERTVAFCVNATKEMRDHTFECRMLTADGHTVWLQDIVTVVVENNQAVKLRGVMVDITERKRMEEALRDSQVRLQQAVQASNLGPWDWDLRTNTVYFSPEWKRQIGHEKHEIPGRYEEWESRLHPEDREPTLDALRAYLDGRQPEYAVEFRLRHKDGSYRWIYTRGEMLRGADGKPFRMLGCHLDITERKRAEQTLAQVHADLKNIMETVPDIIFTLDCAGNLVGWNERLEVVTGYTYDELMHKSALSFVPTDEGAQTAAAIQLAFATGYAELEGHLLLKDGRTIPYHWNGAVLKNHQGDIIGITGVGRDITEHKRTEEERGDLYKRLQESHKGLRTLSQRLLEAQELERRRIARELHDETGQTLTSLLIGMRTLEEMPMRKEVRKRVSELRKTAARAINEIKRLALGLHPSVLDDLGLETALTRLTEEFIHAHGLMVDLQMNGLDEKRLPLVVETILYRIAQEALTNVAKHAGGARVSILLQCSPSAAKVIIEDDGRGFDVQAVLKSAGRSNHMGLHGMRERAALLNGSVEIESTPGGGTTIYVQVPIGRGSA